MYVALCEVEREGSVRAGNVTDGGCCRHPGFFTFFTLGIDDGVFCLTYYTSIVLGASRIISIAGKSVGALLGSCPSSQNLALVCLRNPRANLLLCSSR